jgi:hypothetical protein
MLDASRRIHCIQDILMRNTLWLFAAIALTVLCWGMYGPVLQLGQVGMSTVPGAPARLRPFVCVGLAYFLIGVIVPSLWLHFRGEKGDWSLMGIAWSLAGGAMGALGALGIILAFTFGGSPVYVMPLVFGGAPVINAFLTIYLAGKMKEIGPWFLAGLIIVVLWAVLVMVTAPHASPPPAATGVTPAVQTAPEPVKPPATTVGESMWTYLLRVLSIALAIGSWGAYGPVLHKGQAAMHHSRMRPLICVGIAYFVIAVIVPYFFLGEMGEASTYRSMGTIWSLLGGAFGAIGALGIILAFNSGGKPVFVMPLVFGGAPVINTAVAVSSKHMWGSVSSFFWAGLILVVVGAVIVLVMAPRGEPAKAV